MDGFDESARRMSVRALMAYAARGHGGLLEDRPALHATAVAPYEQEQRYHHGTPCIYCGVRAEDAQDLRCPGRL